MESKHMLMSALGVGIGVGVGLGLASGTQAVGKWAASKDYAGVTPEIVEQEMLNLVCDGRDSNVSFDRFPYYISEQTRVLLTSAALVYLNKFDFTKHTRNLSPASRTILLSGPAELYHQMISKALAHYFEAKLLILDVTDFSLKIQRKYGGSIDEASFKRSVSESTLGRMSELLGSFSLIRKEENKGDNQSMSGSGRDDCRSAKLRRNASAANIYDMGTNSNSSASGSLKRSASWCFDEKLFVKTLYKILMKVSKLCPVVLYLRDVEKLLFRSERLYILFQKMLKRLSGSILILGSRIVSPEDECRIVDENVSAVFPYNVEIRPPEDEVRLISWRSQLEEDMKMIQYQDNRNHILEVLAANDLDCDDLDSICLADTINLSNFIDEIVISAISFHLMDAKEEPPQYRNGKLVISSKSLSHGLSVFQEGKNNSAGKIKESKKSTTESKNEKPTPKSPSVSCVCCLAFSELSLFDCLLFRESQDFPPDNEFEKRIRPEVVPASEIGVTFGDIGALDEIKESLQELVMLPLRRPDLFEGGLLKPCRGILLFGPPGTGKTMLAKAIANESGASFINVSMSTVTSKWFGEDEKNVRALFTVAAKVSPSIIFIDEVDSMLGQRNRAGEHEAMRKIKNEFMAHWDGLMTKPGEKILVLAATNRPFDLDEAIIRRFERRIMVGLPSSENREKILNTLLSKEKAIEGLDFEELARMTEGYTGSDLKNLCITAAYRPVRELIQNERRLLLQDQAKNRRTEEGERKIAIRPITMDDLHQAKKQVAPSFASEGSIMNELKQWNEIYGEGGSRKKEQLSYFM
ncbi:hypothetical protein M569_03307 [Genlisea aurea]|uniref:AAA+ ATPase domain-containing protein n=1 Tax=Genlisea aurea TaxID=192259 RepID=S8E6J8_9LAMI|nr:hypothetical protein M569_03307 [Genlisea aurea]